MKKEKIFSKFNTRNFNNELEEVLAFKPFSENVKNNILNMVYKVEEAYEDYRNVKVNVQSEREFLGKILNSIKNYCNSFQITNSIEMKEQKYLINYEEGNVKVIPNNVWMLYAILGILMTENDEEKKLDIFTQKPISKFLKIGYNIDNVEVIRDFNGWSWSISLDEIYNLKANLIYQNLSFLLGNKFIEKFMKEAVNSENFVEKLEYELENKYDKKTSEKIIELLNKIAIIEISNIDSEFKQKILEIKIQKLKELTKMENKKEYLIEISNIKKENLEIIKNIDKLVNDRKLLKEEYKARNSLLKNSEKIFSVSCLVEILNNERNNSLEKIAQINSLMEPKKYVQKKEEIKSIIDYVNINESEKTNSEKFIIEMQKIFIECLLKEISRLNEKEEIIKKFYKIRYYINIPYNKDKYVKDISELKEEIEKLRLNIIKKLFENRLIVEFSNNQKFNYKIVSKILNTRIINLETIFIILKKQEKEIKIEIYDEEDELNSIQNIEIEDEKNTNIKLNKKIKLFI